MMNVPSTMIWQMLTGLGINWRWNFTSPQGRIRGVADSNRSSVASLDDASTIMQSAHLINLRFLRRAASMDDALHVMHIVILEGSIFHCLVI